MSTDELSPPTIRPADPRSQQEVPIWRRPWVVPLSVLTVLFVGYVLPPYLTLDPAQARLQPLPEFAGYYALLVTHIFLGSVVLLTACLQVWPGCGGPTRRCTGPQAGSMSRPPCRRRSA